MSDWREILVWKRGRGRKYFEPSEVEVCGTRYNLETIKRYNPNYLDRSPPYVVIQFRMKQDELVLEGGEALMFDKAFREALIERPA